MSLSAMGTFEMRKLTTSLTNLLLRILWNALIHIYYTIIAIQYSQRSNRRYVLKTFFIQVEQIIKAKVTVSKRTCNLLI